MNSEIKFKYTIDKLCFKLGDLLSLNEGDEILPDGHVYAMHYGINRNSSSEKYLFSNKPFDRKDKRGVYPKCKLIERLILPSTSEIFPSDLRDIRFKVKCGKRIFCATFQAVKIIYSNNNKVSIFDTKYGWGTASFTCENSYIPLFYLVSM